MNGTARKLARLGASTTVLAFAAGFAGLVHAQDAGAQAAAQRPAQATSPSSSVQTAAEPVAAGRASGAQRGDPVGGAPTGQDVVVTGFRASLRSALNTKRNEEGIVDAIKAEDIAAFPDNNLAEAIQRIPGVSIDRDAGEGRTITVRGLGPSFTRVRLNGIEAQATTGGSDNSGGVNRGRGFDFNVFASELFNSITVRKTQAAEVEEGSLGATVDLQSTRPFDLKRGVNFAASIQEGYNDLRDKYGPRVAFLASDTWFGGKLGGLVSVAYQERYLREEGYNSTRWDNGPSSGGFCSPVGVTPQNPANSTVNGVTAANCATGDPRLPATTQNAATYAQASAASTFHPRLPAFNRLDYDNKRLGLTGSLQWRPDRDTLINLDMLYARYQQERGDYGLSAISFSRTATQGGKPQTSVVDTVIAPDGDMVYGLFNGVDFRTSSRFDKTSTDFFQWGVSGSHNFTDKFRMDFLVGRATSIFKNPVQTTVTFDNRNLNGFSWDYRPNSTYPVLVFPFNPTDPNSFSILGGPGAINGAAAGSQTNISEIRIRPQGAKNWISTMRLDLTYELTPQISLKGGVNGKTYQFSTYAFRRATQDDSVNGLPTGVNMADISTLLTGFGKNLNGAPGSWIVPDIGKVAALYNIYCNCLQNGAPAGPGDYTLTSITNGNARQQNQLIREADFASYAQVNFRTNLLFDRTLRGDIGMRFLHTQLRSTGYQATGGGTQVTIGNTYDDALPSMNLAYDLVHNVVLRLGAAKTIARPELSTYQVGGSFSSSGRTATIGNPFLQPFRATTYDVSGEWYFRPESLVSVALFYKDINTYIQQLRTQIPFNETGLPVTLLPSSIPATEPFQVTTFLNTPGGPLKGVELTYQQPFNFGFLPGWARGFGTILNYTYVKAPIKYVLSPTNATTVEADLIGLSRNAYNATLYYETKAFRARVSASYRDPYLQVVPGRNNNDVEGKHQTFNLDASASYNVTPQLSLTLEALNLTDQYNEQYVDSVRDSPSYYTHTGRQLYFGARYKF